MWAVFCGQLSDDHSIAVQNLEELVPQLNSVMEELPYNWLNYPLIQALHRIAYYADNGVTKITT